jgi:hypothetical protein
MDQSAALSGYGNWVSSEPYRRATPPQAAALSPPVTRDLNAARLSILAPASAAWVLPLNAPLGGAAEVLKHEVAFHRHRDQSHSRELATLSFALKRIFPRPYSRFAPRWRAPWPLVQCWFLLSFAANEDFRGSVLRGERCIIKSMEDLSQQAAICWLTFSDAEIRVVLGAFHRAYAKNALRLCSR